MDTWTRKPYNMLLNDVGLYRSAKKAVATPVLWDAAQQLKALLSPRLGDWAVLVNWAELAIMVKEKSNAENQGL